jgi:predicted DCC family thiol-disulfide oxidoreductase YuxK
MNVLLFDGICNLCNGAVQFIIAHDKKSKFKFASLQSAIGQSLLHKFNLDTENLTSLVLIVGDEYFIKSTAALRILKELGGIWKLFYVLIVLPTPFRDFIYDQIAKERYKLFGKRDACIVPTAELKHRFLE